MIAVGLTGGIATGKSTVAAVLKGQGCILLDADEMAREVVAPNSPGLEALCREFGTGILNESGELNRRYLGDIVFRDPAAKKKLETILHPLIISKIRASLEEYSQDFGRVVVVDAPLLFETGLDSLMDCTLVVYTDEETQHKRLMKRDKLGEEEARLRIASQMPLKEKVKKADFTIDNGGSLEAAEEQAMKIWQKLQDMAREAGGRGLQA